jgi:hypothetical protein
MALQVSEDPGPPVFESLNFVYRHNEGLLGDGSTGRKALAYTGQNKCRRLKADIHHRLKWDSVSLSQGPKNSRE